jgi:hypothetical protein
LRLSNGAFYETCCLPLAIRANPSPPSKGSVQYLRVVHRPTEQPPWGTSPRILRKDTTPHLSHGREPNRRTLIIQIRVSTTSHNALCSNCDEHAWLKWFVGCRWEALGGCDTNTAAIRGTQVIRPSIIVSTQHRFEFDHDNALQLCMQEDQVFSMAKSRTQDGHIPPMSRGLCDGQ